MHNIDFFFNISIFNYYYALFQTEIIAIEHFICYNTRHHGQSYVHGACSAEHGVPKVSYYRAINTSCDAVKCLCTILYYGGTLSILQRSLEYGSVDLYLI